ncbi:MAG: hypothetical protein ACR2NU_12335, partial [Aeoliella sp.]
LEALVGQEQWLQARHLMHQILLESSSSNRGGLPVDPETGQVAPLLDQSENEWYKLHETDVRAEINAQRLAQQYKGNQSPAAKQELLAQLQTIVAQQFQARQKIREMELAKLEARIEKVKAQLLRRQELSETIIERHVNQLTGQADELDWDYGVEKPTSGRYSPGAIPYVEPEYIDESDLQGLRIEPTRNPSNRSGLVPRRSDFDLVPASRGAETDIAELSDEFE